jgi:hypothetical protein
MRRDRRGQSCGRYRAGQALRVQRADSATLPNSSAQGSKPEHVGVAPRHSNISGAWLRRKGSEESSHGNSGQASGCSLKTKRIWLAASARIGKPSAVARCGERSRDRLCFGGSGPSTIAPARAAARARAISRMTSGTGAVCAKTWRVSGAANKALTRVLSAVCSSPVAGSGSRGLRARALRCTGPGTGPAKSRLHGLRRDAGQ